MKKLFLLTTLLLFTSAFIRIQAQTKEELKVEREELNDERKSEAYQKRQKRLSELKAPSPTEISSIDGFVPLLL